MTPARRDGQQRRNALLDAALACVGEKGILGTGIEDIRRAAGASPSSVYHQFEGLPDLMLALLERTFERLFAHLARRVTATRTPRQAVLALVDGHLEWVLAHRAEARFMYQAMSLGVAAPRAAALAATKAALLAPVVAHLARFIAAGTLPRWSPLAFDVVLLGPSHEACRRYLDGAALDPAWMRAQLPALAWRSVRVTAPSDVSPRRARGRSSRRAL